MAPQKHDLKYLSVDELLPNSWNPQSQTDATFERLVSEITEVGFIDPCEVVPMDNGFYTIIGGEHRWRAAKQAGLEEIPCLILQGKKWMDADLQKFVTLRLNSIRGKVDPEKFASLYEEMAEKYGKEPLSQLMGYTDAKVFDKLVNGIRKGLKKSLPPELMAEFDKAAKSAKTAEDLEKIVQMLFAKYGDTVDLSYMIFTYGKQEHLYISMSSKVRKAMKKLCQYAEHTKTDINELMAAIVEGGVAPLIEKLEDEAKATKSPVEVDNGY